MVLPDSCAMRAPRARTRACASLAVLLLALVSPLSVRAARFGVRSGATDPAGYFVLTGPEVPQVTNNLGWGDKRHAIDFYIEVTGTALRVDLYDPGLVSATAGNLDLFFSGDIGTVTYRLFDPDDVQVTERTYGADTEGPGGTNLALDTLYDGPARPGLYRLGVTMDDTATVDEDINGFGVSVPGYDFYSYHFTGGELNLAAATITEPLVVYPLVVRSTPGVYDNEDITGVDAITFDLDAPTTDPPPDVRIVTPSGRYADLNPSQDNGMFTTNLRGVDVGPMDGTDYGVWELRVSNLSLATEGGNDLNFFSAQICDYAAGVTPDEFPLAAGDARHPVRIYYARDDGSTPQKESLVHVADIVSGPDPALVGVGSVVEVTVTIQDPSSYALTGIDVVTRMAPDAQFTDPVVAAVSAGLNASAAGRDIRITGDAAAGASPTVKYRTTFTPAAPGVIYLTGDGTDLQGGALPTEGTYQTPFTSPPEAERFGPIHMLRVEGVVDNCRITASISGDLDLCVGQSTVLDAGSSIISQCPGAPEFRWLLDGVEIYPFPAPVAITETPLVDAVYRVEVRCSVLPACADFAEAAVTVHPAVSAQAGADGGTCLGRGLTLGGSPSGSGGTGSLSYAWLPTAGLSDASSPNPVFTPVSPASPVVFTLTVTDQAGCSASDSVVVEVYPEVGADAGLEAATCQNVGVRIGGAPSASGGTGVLRCQWSPAQDLDDPLSCNPLCTPSSPASPLSYSLTVTDDRGCTDTSTVNVLVMPDVPPQPVGNTLTCVREGIDVRLRWSLNGSFSYHVRRHDDEAFDRPTSQLLRSLVQDEYLAAGEIPRPPAVAYYRVFSASCSGQEE